MGVRVSTWYAQDLDFCGLRFRLTVPDVIKTRVQTQRLPAREQLAHPETRNLLPTTDVRRTTLQIAHETYRNEGLSAFFRGLGVCSARAFVVNAIQWAVYEWTMQMFLAQKQETQLS